MLKSSPTVLGGAVAMVALATAFTTFDGSSARAQTQAIYGGGGTLAAAVYRDLFNCYGSTSATAPSLGTTSGTNGCATTPINPNAEVLYSPVGSGAGQAAYQFNSPASLGTPTSANPPYVSGDFPSYPYTGLAFGAGDAPLSTAQITQEQSLGFGPAIQVPSLVTSVTIPFNPGTGGGALNIVNSAPVVAGVTGSSGLNLSRDNLCGIFSGAINDWSDTNLAADNGGTQLTTTPTTIKVVYRQDSSGTTFLMSNALVTQCASSAHPMPTAWGTAGSTTYFTHAATLPGFPSNLVSETTLDGPGGGTGTETGSGGIVDAVNGTPFVIGYVSPDYAAPFGVTGHTPAPVTANIENQAAVSGSTGVFIPPGLATEALIMVNATPPATATAGAFATAGINANPSGTNTYPIGGFTWVYLYTCYASSTVVNDLTSPNGGTTGLVKWLVSQYATEQTGIDVPEIMGNHGFTPIPDSWKVKIRADYFASGTSSQIRTAPSSGVCTSGAVAS